MTTRYFSVVSLFSIENSAEGQEEIGNLLSEFLVFLTYFELLKFLE